MRLLVTVRSNEPRNRIDVIPVTMWNPDTDHPMFDSPVRGKPVWVVGQIQRRFWSDTEGRTSRIEIVAQEIAIRKEDIRE